jgi:hypothetical protein
MKEIWINKGIFNRNDQFAMVGLDLGLNTKIEFFPVEVLMWNKEQ